MATEEADEERRRRMEMNSDGVSSRRVTTQGSDEAKKHSAPLSGNAALVRK